MRLILLGLLVLLPHLEAEPSQSDRYKYRPMLCAAKLWNMVRYMHPRVTGDSTAWDSALIAALPKIEDAHSDEELAVALDGMLKTLNDPCTRIAVGVPGPGVSVQSFDADTMSIRAGNGDLSGSIGAGLMLKMGIPQISNLVWDIRSSRMPSLLVARPDIRQLTLAGIGYAFRQHSGYPAADASTARYYSSSLQIVEPPANLPKQDSSKLRRAYLVDKDSAIPIQAIIEQVNGRTAIFSEDPPRDLQAGFTEMVNVLDKIVAEVRIADLYYPDGTTEYAPSRVVLNRGQEAVKAVIHSIQLQDWGMPGERADFAPRPSSFRDMPYQGQQYPSRELRILAAFRIWGIMRYFNPRVSALGDKWDDVLIELVTKFSDAKTIADYRLAIAEMTARTGDRGASADAALINSPTRTVVAPLEVRVIENQLVITQVRKASTAQVGDVIVKMDAQPAMDVVHQEERYSAAPGPAAISDLLARRALTLLGKDNAEKSVAAMGDMKNQKVVPAHRTGDAVQLLHGNIGYADLERVETTGVDAMFDKLQGATAIIFDLRGFPRDNGLAIASRLCSVNDAVAAELVRDVVGIVSGRTQISQMHTQVRIPGSAKQRYTGKTVALIDEISISTTGESAMYFKAANGTVLIGSPAYPTFPAYSTVFDVPGGHKVLFSGQSPRWPDGTGLRDGGVQPDVEVRPTLAGIRGGLDEVLDRAIAYLSK